jgi:hypothetical protein
MASQPGEEWPGGVPVDGLLVKLADEVGAALVTAVELDVLVGDHDIGVVDLRQLRREDDLVLPLLVAALLPHRAHRR